MKMFNRLKPVCTSTSFLWHRIENFSSRVKRLAEDIFARLDIFQKGQITQNELLFAVGKVSAERIGTERLEKGFKKIDTVNKGFLVARDLENYFKQLKMPKDELLKKDFEEIDKNKDGVISSDDWMDHHNARQGHWYSIVRHHFHEIDWGRTGKVTLDQYIEWNKYRYFIQEVFGLDNDYKKYM